MSTPDVLMLRLRTDLLEAGLQVFMFPACRLDIVTGIIGFSFSNALINSGDYRALKLAEFSYSLIMAFFY